MKRNILAALVAGLFLGSSEELGSSSEVQRLPREGATLDLSATLVPKPNPSYIDESNFNESNLAGVSLSLDEKVKEFCEELPWVLEVKDEADLSDPNFPFSLFYSHQTPTLKGYYQLQSQPHLKVHRPLRSYGYPELLHKLDSAAEQLYAEYRATLQVHDLSRENGEHIPPHKSHRQGLDADVGIYWYKDGDYGNSYGHLKKLNPETLQINWDFIKTLQKDRDLDYIFWSQRYIWSMRKFVLENYGAAEWKRYGKVLHYEPGHEDHFHIRINKSQVSQKPAAQKLVARD